LILEGVMLWKLLGVVGVSSVLIAAPLTADAADMAVKAPPLAPAPVPYSWTGWYFGANFGAAWEATDPQFSLSDTSGTGYAAYVAAGGFPLASLSPNGPLGGLQIGYNYQLTNWVAGLEADVQGAALNASLSGVTTPPLFITGTESVEHDLRWFGTVRGRVGFAQSNWLFYGTGGLIYGGVRSVLTQSAPNGFVATGSDNVVRTGPTVGGGFEVGLGKWSAKLEYLYYDMGRDSVTIAGSGVFTGIVYTGSQRTEGQIVRLGLNYRY
jgi:outer membrane immunogenic protein